MENVPGIEKALSFGVVNMESFEGLRARDIAARWMTDGPGPVKSLSHSIGISMETCPSQPLHSMLCTARAMCLCRADAWKEAKVDGVPSFLLFPKYKAHVRRYHGPGPRARFELSVFCLLWFFLFAGMFYHSWAIALLPTSALEAILYVWDTHFWATTWKTYKDGNEAMWRLIALDLRNQEFMRSNDSGGNTWHNDDDMQEEALLRAVGLLEAWDMTVHGRYHVMFRPDHESTSSSS